MVRDVDDKKHMKTQIVILPKTMLQSVAKQKKIKPIDFCKTASSDLQKIPRDEQLDCVLHKFRFLQYFNFAVHLCVYQEPRQKSNPDYHVRPPPPPGGPTPTLHITASSTTRRRTRSSKPARKRVHFLVLQTGSERVHFHRANLLLALDVAHRKIALVAIAIVQIRIALERDVFRLRSLLRRCCDTRPRCTTGVKMWSSMIPSHDAAAMHQAQPGTIDLDVVSIRILVAQVRLG